MISSALGSCCEQCWAAICFYLWNGCSMCFLFLSLYFVSRGKRTCPPAHLCGSAPRPCDIWDHGSQFPGNMDPRAGPGGEISRGLLPRQRRTARWKSIWIKFFFNHKYMDNSDFIFVFYCTAICSLHLFFGTDSSWDPHSSCPWLLILLVKLVL